MNFLWGNVFDYVKERRYAAIFFVTLGLFFLAMLLGSFLLRIAEDSNSQPYWPVVMSGMGLGLAALIWRGIRRMRRRRLSRYQMTPLSRDELAKARSKLTTNHNFKSS